MSNSYIIKMPDDMHRYKNIKSEQEAGDLNERLPWQNMNPVLFYAIKDNNKEMIPFLFKVGACGTA